MDGKEGRHYYAIVNMGSASIVFGSPSSLHYFSIKVNGVHLVEERIGWKNE